MINRYPTVLSFPSC